MAILTRLGFENLARRIMETGGLTPDMEKDVKRLKDDFDEREGILKKYGKTDYDGEEYEWKESEPVPSNRDTTVIADAGINAVDYEKEYKALRQRYIDAFLGVRRNENEKDILENQIEDTIEDSGDKSIDELLYGADDSEKEES